jgi:hypothetical protein
MEVHFIDWNIVHGGLGLRQPAKHPFSEVTLRPRQLTAIDDGLDILQVPMFVFVWCAYFRVSRRNSAAFDSFDSQRDRQAQRIEPGADHLGGHAGVDQSAEYHVAAGARETIEMSHAHESTLPDVRFTEAGDVW